MQLSQLRTQAGSICPARRWRVTRTMPLPYSRRGAARNTSRSQRMRPGRSRKGKSKPPKLSMQRRGLQRSDQPNDLERRILWQRYMRDSNSSTVAALFIPDKALKPMATRPRHLLQATGARAAELLRWRPENSASRTNIGPVRDTPAAQSAMCPSKSNPKRS